MAPKVVIVTGASRGIGHAIATYLVSGPGQSNRVVLLARTAAPLQELQRLYPDQVQYLIGDACEPTIAGRAVELAFKTYGRIDGLVLNHGTMGSVRRVADTKPDEWAAALQVNFISCIPFVRRSLPYLREARGHIIFTSSGAATTGYAAWGLYGVSKAALNHLAMTLGAEEPLVTTMSIRPGPTDTDMQTELREKHLDKMDEKVKQKFTDLKKNGALLKPETPARVMARLVLDGPPSLSGRYLSWNDAELKAFQDS